MDGRPARISHHGNTLFVEYNPAFVENTELQNFNIKNLQIPIDNSDEYCVSI